jgi:hypothetical protein
MANLKTARIEDVIGLTFNKNNIDHTIIKANKRFPDKVSHSFVYFTVLNNETDKEVLLGRTIVSEALKIKILD